MQQQLLYNKIFNKSESDWDTTLFLEKTVEDYPYFGLAHYFNIKNTASSKGSFAPIAAKAALFFNTPFLLRANLYNENAALENATIIDKKVIFSDDNEQEIDVIKATEQQDLPQIKQETTAAFEKVNNNTVSIAEEVLNTADNILPSESTDTLDKVPDSIVTKEEMIFEPLFASDYFASQGIKLSEVIAGDDKLGKQLKSFTSWLKTMKKVHPDKLPLVNEMVEKAVQYQAAISNMGIEVVTEAMADAFILQGKQIRAIEVYEKLSLLNPLKSAYFAAKIEQLKN
jgi:hypothetical protein